MFGLEMACMIVAQAHAAEEEYIAFERAMADLPADVAAKLRKERKDQQEKASIEEQEERRHRELCAAIRATSFWRF